MKITRRGANRSVPITVSCTIIGVARGEAGISIIIKVTETPSRAHARRQRAHANARRLVSYIQADAAHGISNDNLHHLFAVLAFSVDYNVFRYRGNFKKISAASGGNKGFVLGMFRGFRHPFLGRGGLRPLLPPCGGNSPSLPRNSRRGANRSVPKHWQ